MDSPPKVQLSAVAAELGIGANQVESVVRLADEGNTVPFITRYRKEQTGNLDEEQIRAVLERVLALRQLAERAATILRLIDAQGKLTPELKLAIEGADSLKRLEDLYLPFKPKKQTRASAARERGLEPLADAIWNAAVELTDLDAAAATFVSPDKELPSTAEVLRGAADIIAERISEQADVRAIARRHAWKVGKLSTSATDANSAEAQPYRDYFQHSEPAAKIPAHRILAFNRGESASALRVKFEWDQPVVQQEIGRFLKIDEHRFSAFMGDCLSDAVDRLVHPSLEREVRRELTERAEAQAVAVFARNLRNLLLSPPLGGRRVLAIDPGFRTGCKVVMLDEQGNSLGTDLIYVTGGAEKQAANRAKLAALLNTHGINLIAIGNGTACRETEELVAAMIAESSPETQYVIVNEAGASIYSTSNIAREEFPELDATERGTISIGRRVLDPLSELVKIEPQHIGVGMYQHDVDEKTLKESLDRVIESCVNYVGVDLNTASSALLQYVSGLNQLTARRIVEWRTQNGAFRSREQLRDVPGIGQTKFTQAAGFLKIRSGDESLDATWIHPESYSLARQVLARLGVEDPDQLLGGALPAELREKLSQLDVAALAAELQAGVPTLKDIVDALSRPGRDPRSDLPGPIFKKDILKMSDLTPGMELRGTVLNVVDFGAFVDVGLKESGLVHVSQLASRYITNPHEVVSVGDVVTVFVLSVDGERKRVSLSMIEPGTTVERQRRVETKSAAQAVSAAAPTPATNAPAASASLPKPGAPKPPAAKLPSTKKKQRQAEPYSAGTPEKAETLHSFGQLKQFWNKKTP